MSGFDDRNRAIADNYCQGRPDDALCRLKGGYERALALGGKTEAVRQLIASEKHPDLITLTGLDNAALATRQKEALNAATQRLEEAGLTQYKHPSPRAVALIAVGTYLRSMRESEPR